MAAKTGHDKQAAAAQRGRIADLNATAIVLMRDGKRSTPQCDMLERALQLFKESRLGAVVAGSTVAMPQNVQELLSLKLEDMLPKHALDHYTRLSVIYVGELFQEKVWSSWKVFPSKSPRVAQMVRDALENLGLPFDLDLNAVGWQPPYASDPQVLAAWAMREHEARLSTDKYGVCGVEFRGPCGTIAEYIHGRNNVHEPYLRTRMERLGLRMGMYIPSSWEVPKRNRACCEATKFLEWDGERIPREIKYKLEEKDIMNFEELEQTGLNRLKTLLGKDDIKIVSKLVADRGIRLVTGVSKRFFDVSILGLDLISPNQFVNRGLTTLGDLLEKSAADLLREVCGRRAIKEVEEVLANMGLALRNSSN